MNTLDDLYKLIENLPLFLKDNIIKDVYKNQLIEIVLDLGKQPEVRFKNGPKYVSQKIISWQDLEYITKRIGRFSSENRAGIERTLHRISCIRNRQFLINGLTCRIGRSIFGPISAIRDLLESQKSILILGKPGVGKTTVIREIARVLADDMKKRVIVVDTSNEIAGDSDIPHFGIGRARRMQVAQTEYQHQIMIEAVENHMPQVIIIDEIGTDLEVLAAKTIAEKGVTIVGTTHGNYFQNLIKNPCLSNLLGGIEYVTLSDDEAKRRGTQKSILERKFYPTFEIVIELNKQNFWTIHENIEDSVDFLLLNKQKINQTREFFLNQEIRIQCQRFYNTKTLNSSNHQFSLNSISWFKLNYSNHEEEQLLNSKKFLIYPYSLSSNLLKEILLKLQINFVFTHDIKQASVIIGFRKNLRKNLRLKKVAKSNNIPICSINKLSLYQIYKLLTLLNL